MLYLSLTVRPSFWLALGCLILYDNLPGLKACPLDSSRLCTSKCLDTTTRSSFGPMRQNTYPKVNCRCDKSCSIYGDCCMDYWNHCINETDPPLLTSRYSPYFECISPNRIKTIFNFTVVSRCPANWSEDSIRQNCETDSFLESQGLIALLMVNGPPSIVFKNVFCTICHNVPASHINPWVVKLMNCRGPLPPPSGFTLLEWCEKHQMIPPASMKGSPHICFDDLIDTCPENATDPQCGNHTSMVRIIVDDLHNSGLIENIRFKNGYCAECNGYPVESHVCDIQRLPFESSSSLTLLFNFSTQTVHSIEEKGFLIKTRGSPVLLGNCSNLQIYDPFSGVCRNVWCPAGTHLQTGQCVSSQDQDGEFQSRYNYTSDCLQVILSSNITGLTLQDNVSLLVEFSTSQDSDVFIHADFSVAKYIQEGLTHFFNIFENSNACGNSTVMLVVYSSKGISRRSAMWPVCDGMTINSLELHPEVFTADGVFYMNVSGYIYDETEFMQIIIFKMAGEASNNISRGESLKICSPFVESRCPVVPLNRSEFLSENAGMEGGVFVHKGSGKKILAEEVWQLPDDSLRVCNFLSDIDHAIPKVSPVVFGILDKFSCAGSICSLVASILALTTYCLFPVLQNNPGKIVMNLLLALILAQMILLAGLTSIKWLCILRATTLHFAWLAVFSWMTTLSGDLAYTMKSNTHVRPQDEVHSYKVMKLGVLAWGIPAVFVTICFLVSRAESIGSSTWLEYGGRNCWIQNTLHSIFFFGIPVGMCLFINCLLATLMIYMVSANMGRLLKAQMARKLKMEILLCTKLIVITGMTWTLFVIANLVDIIVIWYIAVIFNSLQGALIGLMFLIKENVKKQWKEKLTCLICCHSDATDQMSP